MALAVGSIAFVGYNADGNDNLAFVALEVIAVGEVIYFEDNEWNGSGWNDTNEGAFSWTATSSVAAGTIVLIDNIGSGTITSSTGTVIDASVLSPSRGTNRGIGAGDEVIYAYQGSAASPTFIAAIASGGFNATNGLLTNTGLTAGQNALDLSPLDDDADIAAFNGLRNTQANFAAYLPIINNPVYWIAQDGGGDQSIDQGPPNVPFSTLAFSTGYLPPELAITPLAASQNEGNLGTTAFLFKIERSGDTSAASSASWTVAGTGINPAAASDFIGSIFPNGTVSFAAGETSQTITVNAVGDTTLEQDEGFTITLSAPSGAILDPAASSATGLIVNDDLNQPATYQISGTVVVGQTVSAIRTASDPEGDGTPAFSWQTFAAGSWTPVGAASTYLISAADEGKPLRLLVSYNDASGFAETITVAAGTVPLMPALAITALTPTQNEGSIGSTSFVFEISRNGDLTGSTSVLWSVEGTGTNPATNTDFALNQLPSGTAVFAAGQASLTLNIAVVGDGLVEPDERFQVVLGSASNGLITPATASATSLILNDDLAPKTYTFTASSNTVYEGSPLNIGVATTNVSVGTRLYWQASGTTITDSDFTSGGLTGDVVIGSDGRASFTRTVAADPLVDSDEVMELKFYSDASRSQQVGTTLSITIKEPSVGVITDGNDIITGTAAGEMITGIPVGSSLRGRGSRDELTGGGGNDIFAIGDQSGVYYDDGLSANRGTLDMAIIRDFAAGDRIQLWGDASKYSLVSALFGGVRGVRIDLNPVAPGTLGEAIGFVQAATTTSLNLGNSSQFLYLI
jgi:hypothetical protein